MKCENCIHDGLCYLPDNDYVSKKELENCDRFKDKNKLIELPYKVGDILYTNIGYKYSRLKNRPFSCEVVFIGINYKYSILNVVYQDGSMEQFNSYDIGKTVFLTKEEAKQALKDGVDNE